MELYNKFLVVKHEDINNALTEKEALEFDLLLEKVDKYRMAQGKGINNYYVINQNEPYARRVAALMRGE